MIYKKKWKHSSVYEGRLSSHALSYSHITHSENKQKRQLRRIMCFVVYSRTNKPLQSVNDGADSVNAVSVIFRFYVP